MPETKEGAEISITSAISLANVVTSRILSSKA